jgi:hypothetical protein
LVLLLLLLQHVMLLMMLVLLVSNVLTLHTVQVWNNNQRFQRDVFEATVQYRPYNRFFMPT